MALDPSWPAELGRRVLGSQRSKCITHGYKYNFKYHQRGSASETRSRRLKRPRWRQLLRWSVGSTRSVPGANRPLSAVYDAHTEKETQHGSTSPTTGNFGPRWSTNFFTTQKTTNLRMECSHECARKACVRVPHAQDLTYEALNDWRRS